MAERSVVDSSVVAKWFLKDAAESDVDVADEILLELLAGDRELYAPMLVVYEVCGLLTKACKQKDQQTKIPRLSSSQAATRISELFQLPIRLIHASEAEELEASRLAVDYSKNHYDMVFVSLAQRLDCSLVTADARLLKPNPAGFPSHRVVLLSSLRRP